MAFGLNPGRAMKMLPTNTVKSGPQEVKPTAAIVPARGPQPIAPREEVGSELIAALDGIRKALEKQTKVQEKLLKQLAKGSK